MYIKLNGKKINIRVLTNFKERFISYKFYLEPITEGLCFPKKRWFHTYFFCQKVDIVMTDKDNKILYMYPSLKSERKIYPKNGVYYTYVFPDRSTSKLKIGDKLKTSE